MGKFGCNRHRYIKHERRREFRLRVVCPIEGTRLFCVTCCACLAQRTRKECTGLVVSVWMSV